MNLEMIPIKGQKFDIGRTINPFKCDCVKCDFMNCPKHNYAVKMKYKRYSVDVFWNAWKDRILEINKPKRWQYSFQGRYDLRLTWDMINDFFDLLRFTFPKGTYWSPDSAEDNSDKIEETVYREISLIKFSRKGSEIRVGGVEIGKHNIFDYDLSEQQYKLAEKIRDNLRWLKDKVFEHYREQDNEWKIGWLSPEGRHYPCSHCEHTVLAARIGFNEHLLESQGWVKVALDDTYHTTRRFLTAEQRNWLSLNGYDVED